MWGKEPDVCELPQEHITIGSWLPEVLADTYTLDGMFIL